MAGDIRRDVLRESGGDREAVQGTVIACKAIMVLLPSAVNGREYGEEQSAGSSVFVAEDYLTHLGKQWHGDAL